jgi:hypothetical protein
MVLPAWRLSMLLFVISAAPLEAAFERSPIEPFSRGRRAESFGRLGAPYSTLGNPAFSPDLTIPWVMGGLTPSPFGLPELSSGFVAAVIPTAIGPVTGDLSATGFSLYREGTARIGVAAMMAPELAACVRFSLSYLSIAGYGAAAAPGIDVGCAWRPLTFLSFGWMVERVNSPPLSRFGDRLPAVMMFEASANPFSRSEIWIAAREEPDFPAEVRFGCSLQIHQSLLLRLSTCNNPSEISCGADLLFDPVVFVYAVSFHPVLGATHSIGLAFRVGK